MVGAVLYTSMSCRSNERMGAREGVPVRAHCQGDIEQTQVVKFIVSYTRCATGKSSSEIHICGGGSREGPQLQQGHSLIA